MVYYRGYPGVYAMEIHDGHPELRRWFENWRASREAKFNSDYEYLLVEEKKFTTVRGRERVRYVGRVGEEGEPTRPVEFDHTAPPPPSFYARPRLTRSRFQPPRAVRYPHQVDIMQSMVGDFKEMASGLRLRLDLEHQRVLEEMEYYRHAYRPPKIVIEASKVVAVPPPRYRRNT